MSTINDVKTEIRLITQKLSSKTLLRITNYPELFNNEIRWNRYSGISFELKQDSYSDIYSQILNDWNFNFVLLDWWIIQLQYSFDNRWDKLISHRLTYYPDIYGVQLWENPEEYEENIFGLRTYGDLCYKENVSTPIRFDYSSNIGSYVEHLHSKSHLSLGWYKSCRITNSGPISPNQFILFILKSFYLEKYIEYDLWKMFETKIFFPESISANEKKYTHIFLR